MSNVYEVGKRFLSEFKKTCKPEKGFIPGEELNRLASLHLSSLYCCEGLLEYSKIFEKVKIAVIEYVFEISFVTDFIEQEIIKEKNKRIKELESFLEENKAYLETYKGEFPKA